MPEGPPRVDAFVSYSRRNADRARAVVDAARRLERSFWLDTADLQPGTAWSDELRRALESADAVVCMLSAAWLASAQCRREYDTGHQLGKRIVPVLLEELSYDDLPPSMRSVQWVDARELDADAVAARVVAAIDLDIERVRAHTLWLGRALRWEGTGRERSLLPRGRELRDAEAFLAAAGVDPAPVAVQSEYVAAGRTAERRRQRILLASVTTAFAVAVVLSLVSLHLRGVADDQRARAEKERDAAVTRSLIEQSRSLALTDPMPARQAALAAWRVLPGPDTRAAVLQVAADRALRVFETGSAPQFAAALSPDGHTLATGGDDGVVRLWEVGPAEDGAEELRGHREAVRFLVWSSDGSLLASASDDGEVRVWDPRTRREVVGPYVAGPDYQDGHGNLSWGAAFSPDGTRLAMISTDGHLTVFDLTTDRQVARPLPRNPEPLTAVLWAPDRTLVVTGDDDRVRFVDGTSGRRVEPAISIAGGANPTLALTHDGTVLAVGQGDGKVSFWSMADHAHLADLAASTDGIRAVAFSADDRVIATSAEESAVRLWDIHTLDPWGPALPIPTGSVWGLGFGPDRRDLFTAGSDGVVRQWDLQLDGPSGPPVPVEDGRATAVATAPDGRLLVGTSGSALTEWDPDAQRTLGSLTMTEPSTVSAVAVSHDGRYAVAGTVEGRLYLWDLGSQQLLAQTTIPVGGAVRGAEFTPDGHDVVVASGESLDTLSGPSVADPSVREWSVPDLREQPTYITQPGSVKAMAVTADGGHAVTSTADEVEVLDLASQRVVARRTVGPGPAPLATSPDGRWVAVGTAQGISILGLSDLRPHGRVLSGGTGTVTSLAFSPDSGALVSGGDDGALRVWDLATRTSVGAARTGQGGDVVDLAVARDGTFAASAGNGTARVWDTSFLADPVAFVCGQTGRSLTAQEWRDLVGSGVPYRRTC